MIEQSNELLIENHEICPIGSVPFLEDESIYYHYDGKGHLSCTYPTLKHLTNNEKSIETHFAYEDSDSDNGHMDATHLDIIIFFAKPNGSIDHLIGYESVKEKRFSHIDINVYMKNECSH